MLKVNNEPSDSVVVFKSEPELIIEAESHNNEEHLPKQKAHNNINQSNKTKIVISSDSDSDDDCYILNEDNPLVIIDDDKDYGSKQYVITEVLKAKDTLPIKVAIYFYFF